METHRVESGSSIENGLRVVSVLQTTSRVKPGPGWLDDEVRARARHDAVAGSSRWAERKLDYQMNGFSFYEILRRKGDKPLTSGEAKAAFTFEGNGRKNKRL